MLGETSKGVGLKRLENFLDYRQNHFLISTYVAMNGPTCLDIDYVQKFHNSFGNMNESSTTELFPPTHFYDEAGA